MMMVAQVYKSDHTNETISYSLEFLCQLFDSLEELSNSFFKQLTVNSFYISGAQNIKSMRPFIFSLAFDKDIFPYTFESS